MKKFFFLTLMSACLSCEITADGEFFAHIAGTFSITIDARTLAKDLGTLGSSVSMGSFIVSITDTVTSPPTVTNKVMLYSNITDPDDNSQVQIVRQDNLDGGVPATQFPTRIDVSIEDDRDINGALNATAITNNQSIRDRLTTGGTITNEEHTLTFTAAAHDGTKEGNYRTTIYFQMVTE